MDISNKEAIKEMRFLYEGYKGMTDCSNPSKKNIKLMKACEKAIEALIYQEETEAYLADIKTTDIKSVEVQTISLIFKELESVNRQIGEITLAMAKADIIDVEQAYKIINDAYMTNKEEDDT